MSARSELAKILAELKAKQVGAARRGNAVMWAFYYRVWRLVRAWFRGYDDTAFVQAAQELINKELPKDVDAAHWHVAAVYARRILRAAGCKVPRPSLQWLRDRAEEE